MYEGKDTELFRQEALNRYYEGRLAPGSPPLSVPLWIRVLFGLLMAGVLAVPVLLRYAAVQVPVDCRAILHVGPNGSMAAVVEIPERYVGTLAPGDVVPVRWSAGPAQGPVRDQGRGREEWVVSDIRGSSVTLKPTHDLPPADVKSDLTGTATVATVSRPLLAVLSPSLATRLGVDEDDR